MPIKLWAVLILAGIALLFIFQNVAAVEIQFLLWSIQISRSLLMLMMLLIGTLLGWFLRGYRDYKKSHTHGPAS